MFAASLVALVVSSISTGMNITDDPTSAVIWGVLVVVNIISVTLCRYNK
jgi:hypothetical protein